MANQVYFGIATPQQNVTYERLLSMWREADREPLVDHLWLFDHFVALGDNVDGPCYEAWTTLAGLAAHTERVGIGHLVTGNTYRHPAILARQAVTVDHISQGRLYFGIGAAWHEQEHRGFGIPFPGAGERVRRLEEACQVIRQLWTETKPTFNGRYYQLEEAHSEPKPIQKPHPPIIIAASGEQMLRVVAKHADIWASQSRTIEDFREKSARLDQRCEEIGRDPATLARLGAAGIDPAASDFSTARTYLTQMIEAGATHIVVNPSGKYPAGVIRLIVDEVIQPIKQAINV
jgi:F420-dependent oxidoreductase-like protein